MFSKPKENFLFHLPRQDIEAGTCTSVLDAFPLEELSADMLRRMEGAVTFIVAGYQQDPRELFEIPEVRTFLKALHEETDGSLAFFSELTTSFVATLARCQIVQSEENTVAQMENLRDFIPFFQSGTRAIHRLGHVAGMTGAQITRKERRFACYLEDHLNLECRFFQR